MPPKSNSLTTPNKSVNTPQQKTLNAIVRKMPPAVKIENATATTPSKSLSTATSKSSSKKSSSKSAPASTSSKKRSRNKEVEEEEEVDDEEDDDEEEEQEDAVERHLYKKRQKTSVKREREVNDFKFLKPEEIRDAEGHRPDDPNYNPSTLYIPSADLSTMTDMEQQYWKIKSKRFDCLLLFKKGKFYEMYERDADVANLELGMKITHEIRGAMRMCGFPESRLTKYTEIFVGKGYKVAVADQLESSLDKVKKTGPVRREVTAVYTPATFSPMDTFVQSKFLLCIKESGKRYGVTIMHASIGEFTIGSFEDDDYKTQLSALLYRLQPREILVDKTREGLSFEAHKAIKSVRPTPLIQYIRPMDQINSNTEAINYLTALPVFEEEQMKQVLDQFQDDDLAICSFASVAKFLQSLEMAQELFETASFEEYQPDKFTKTNLVLDAQTLFNLEICQNNFDGTTRGTLLGLLDYCKTPFGKRRFVQWLQFPLRDAHAIIDRQNAIEDLKGSNSGLLEILTQELKYFQSFDLERLAQRIHTDSVKQKEAAFYTDDINKQKVFTFLKILEGFNKLYSIFTETITNEVRNGFESSFLKHITNIVPVEEFIQKRRGLPDVGQLLSDFYTKFDYETAKSEGIIYPAEGTNDQYDKLIAERQEWIQKIEAELQALKKIVKRPIDTYKCDGSAKSELFFDITVEPSKKHELVEILPPEYTVAAKSKKTVLRVYSSELHTLQRGLDVCELNMKKETRQNFKNLVLLFNEHKDCWRRYIYCASELECIMSLAHAVEKHQNLVRPTIVPRNHTEKPFLELKGMRHPFIHCDSFFVPNDTFLGGLDEANRHRPLFMVLTGPNMGGKSTLMRQVCIAIIMAQMGCYVPADSMTFTPCDRIFTRIGATDKIMSGESTFMVELNETNSILKNATVDSFVILDELGRGTGTFDGYSIASAVGEYIASQIRCRTLFTTHYQMLHDEWAHNPLMDFYMMSVSDAGGLITPTYKLVKGVSASSHAVACAKKARIPDAILKDAEKISEQFKKYMEPAKEKLQKLALEVSLDAMDTFRRIYHIVMDDSMEDDEKCTKLQELQPVAESVSTNQV